MGFFDKLFGEDELLWALHTTMTCDLNYVTSLIAKQNKSDLVEKRILPKELDKTAVFYHPDPSKNRVLRYKASGKKIKIRMFKKVVYELSGNQTFHAKISLVAYKRESGIGYRLAVYSKNHEFNVMCNETALLFELELQDKQTESGVALCAYLEKLQDNVDEKGKKWIKTHITKEIYESLKKCKLISEFGKEAELYFGGCELDNKLGSLLQLDSVEADSIVLTPPEYIKQSESVKRFFKKKKILYDLKATNSLGKKSSHIKLYLLHKNEGPSEIFELWIGSANATNHGIGWDFHNNMPGNIESIECLVKFQLNKDEFITLRKGIIENYEKFLDFSKEGSLKIKVDRFGPWMCTNYQVDHICYYDKNNQFISGTNESMYRGKVSKVCVNLVPKYDKPKSQLKVAKGLRWRLAEYNSVEDISSRRTQLMNYEPICLEYPVTNFRPSQGMLCFGSSESIMWFAEKLMNMIPQVKDNVKKDTRLTQWLLSENNIEKSFNVDRDEREELCWLYNVVYSQDKMHTLTQGNVEKQIIEKEGQCVYDNKLICTNDEAKKILETKPLPFQEKAAEQLFNILQTNSRAFLADEPGLGKTYSATQLMCKLARQFWQSNRECFPYYVIYVAPNSALLKKNGQDIIDKARGLLNADEEIHMLSEYIPQTQKQKLLYAIEFWYRKRESCIESEYRLKLQERKSELIQQILLHEDKDFDKNGYSKKIITNFYNNRDQIENDIPNKAEKRRCSPKWKEIDDILEIVKEEYPNPDRMVYAGKILNQLQNCWKKKTIILLTISQGVAFDTSSKPCKEKELIKKILSDEKENQESRDDATYKILKSFLSGIIIWDEFHRYSTAFRNYANNAFFRQEKDSDGRIKSLFVSATPYRSNVSGKKNIDTLNNLYNQANKPDDKEEMEALPGFEEDFAPLYCGGTGLRIEPSELIKSYKAFNEDPFNEKGNFEKIMKMRMVRNERARLQGILEEHVRECPVEKNYTEEMAEVLRNTVRQSRLLEKAEYNEGARRWGLSLPWILDFSTERGKSKKQISKNAEETVDTYFQCLSPDGKKLDEELFAYDDQGKIKETIKGLQKQNIAFYQICKKNVKEKMCQLLWVPPTVPLYKSGSNSIFEKYKDYSKLLVFAEYRYLQRGGARLLSDYVKESNAREEKIPTFNLRLMYDNTEIDYSIYQEDYRNITLDNLINKIKSEKNISDEAVLNLIAAPFLCAKRIPELTNEAKEIHEAFVEYFNKDGVREALWNWFNDNGYHEQNMNLGILRYCAEGNLQAVLEEWVFMLKNVEGKTKAQQICDCLKRHGSCVYVQTLETTKMKTDGKEGRCSFAEQLTEDVTDIGSGGTGEQELACGNAFSSPMWPMVMFAGRGAQEGMDFHQYCLRIMHLTLPRGAVSFEQRNGRIDRFRSLLIRRRVAKYMSTGQILDNTQSLLKRMIASVIREKNNNPEYIKNPLYPNWFFPQAKSEIYFEQMIPIWEYTEESNAMIMYDEMLRSYRGSFGINSANISYGIDLSTM